MLEENNGGPLKVLKVGSNNDNRITLNEIEKVATMQIEEIKQDCYDRFNLNEEVRELKLLLEIQNSKYRAYKINKKLSVALQNRTTLNVANRNIKNFFNCSN